MSKMQVLRPLLLAGACAAAATASQAAEVNLTGWAFGSGQTVNVVAPTYNGEGGGFVGSLSGAVPSIFDSSSFITYSVELSEGFSLGGGPMTGYNIVTGNSYAGWGANAATISSKIGRLMTYADSNPAFVDDSAESGSLQLAIWNAIYDSDQSLNAGVFKNTANTGINALANDFLSNSFAVTSQYSVFVLTKAGSQDFLLLQRAPTSTPVPTPASLALVGLALALLWGTSRRRA